MSDARSKLRERCAQVLSDFEKIRIENPPSQARWEKLVDHLECFVYSEIGRAADERLGDAAPLVLYL